MKFAILGAGHIASKMAEAVNGIEGATLYAVASRSIEKAKAFAKEWNVTKAYGSYEEMLNDEEVELVYVATPHSHHFEHGRLCLLHGKNVLVEKPFTVNARQAEELINLSAVKNCFIAEAIWTRYMPSRNMINELLESGVIGKPTSLTANLGYPLGDKERLVEPSLAGGALLDLGVYPLNFALMVFGDDIKEIKSSAVLSDKGVDLNNSITLIYNDGKMAVLHSNMLAAMDRTGVIYGDAGYIEIVNINNCEEIRVYNTEHVMTVSYKVPEQINGYEYEVISCVRAINEGKRECPEMPHAETLKVMKMLDEIRKQWGMKYPCE